MTADEKTRVRIAASPKTDTDTLLRLVSDPSVIVRASAAMNPALPLEGSAVLAGDGDARVRAILRHHLGKAAPAASGGARQVRRTPGAEKLEALVTEAGLRVRRKLAETVQDNPDSPRDVVVHLARDPDPAVSEPVILFSPVLRSEDLVSLVESGPGSRTLAAVARRQLIDATVADTIVAADDGAAITALLRNRSARLREATLEALAAQSEEHPDWQEPLVRRPLLSPRAVRTLSEIVPPGLLGTLADRPDIDPNLAERLRGMAASGRSGDEQGAQGKASGPDGGAMTPSAGLAQASALAAAGQLDDSVIQAALRRNALMQASTMLAVKAGVPLTAVQRAARLRSAKGMASLCMKAGLAAKTAVALQTVLARVAANQVIRPDEAGRYPVSSEEMHAQLNSLGINEPGLRAWIPRRLIAVPAGG